MTDRDLPTFVHLYFGGFQPAGPPVRAPLELARHLVYGGVAAARRLGFEPHADFAAAAEHLGPWTESSAITFGRHGATLYVAGPYDHADAVIATLTETVDAGRGSVIGCRVDRRVAGSAATGPGRVEAGCPPLTL